MRKISSFLAIALFASTLFSCSNATDNQPGKDAAPKERIVSLNGAVTEIISDLGHEKELVGRDVTSTYPQWVKDSVKDLGHVRSISVEAILALNPALILASDKDLPPAIDEKLKNSGIKFKVFHQDFSVDGTKQLIGEVAQFIGDDKAQSLQTKIDSDLTKVKTFSAKPKVLFIYARGAGTMMVAGGNTPLESMINLAGGANAATGFTDFKPLTPEALVNSNPDVILLFDSGLQSLGGIDGLLKIPGVAQTNAGKNKAVITMDGGLLADFGPRLGEAAVTLNSLLAKYAQ